MKKYFTKKHFKLTLNIFLIHLFFSCAQPKYIQKTDDTNSAPSYQKNKADCNVQLKNSKLCLSWLWELKPTETEMGSFVFKIYKLNNYDQTAIMMENGDKVEVVLWMPSMGHGSSPTTVEKLDVGTYRTHDVFFTMPGEWQIKFQFKNLNNELTDEAIVDIQI